MVLATCWAIPVRQLFPTPPIPGVSGSWLLEQADKQRERGEAGKRREERRLREYRAHLGDNKNAKG